MLNWPTAQKRTSHWKKFVFVGDEVIKKGPYKANDESLALARRNVAILSLLQDICELPGSLRTDLPILREEDDGNGGKYLVYENVGRKPAEADSEMSSTKIDTDVLVLRRGTFVDRVSDCEKSLGLPDVVARASLQHLYFRYLMGVGDSGTHNILIRKDANASGKVVAGIDMEERRKNPEKLEEKDGSSVMWLLFKRPSAAQVALYRPYLRDIVLIPGPTDVQMKELARLGSDVSMLLQRSGRFASLLKILPTAANGRSVTQIAHPCPNLQS
jgi:hypothetical protein